MGIVFSDSHRLAPYSDYSQPAPGKHRSEDIIEKTLSNKKITFCVMNGDIEEVVNLPVKHLPKTQGEQDKIITDLVEDYANKRFVALSKDELRKVPRMTEEELLDFLYEVRGKGFQEIDKHQVNPRDVVELFANPEKARDEILAKVPPLRDNKIDDVVKLHTDHLEYLVKHYPHVTFHYVIGNHERMDFFIKAMNDLKERLKSELGEDRLKIYEDYVKIGDGLYMHGDQQMNPKKYKSSGPDKYKESFAELERPFWRQVIEDRFNKFIPGALLAHTIHTPAQCALNIMRELHKNHPERLEGVRHIFTGHTHTPYTNEKFVYHSPDKKDDDGELYIFHNTGAALSRFKSLNKDVFNPLLVTMKVNPELQVTTGDPCAYYTNAEIAKVIPLRQVMTAMAI